MNLDILLYCGSGILHGDILTSSRYGVLSIHHGNNNINRGGPPGFWEVYSKNPSSGCTIQILNEELDGGRILFRGLFRTKPFYVWNQLFLWKKGFQSKETQKRHFP